MLGICVFCGDDIYPDDESCSETSGEAHVECAETEDPEELNRQLIGTN